VKISATFTPAEFEARDVSGATVVIIDCFRASTSIVAALSAGASAVYPFPSVAQAREAARTRPGAVLAGERGGARIPGFDLGNSPGEFSTKSVGGRDVMMTTTNGTRLLAAAGKAADAYVAAFVNAAATADALLRRGGDVILAAAGTEGSFSVEDALCGGLIAAGISGASGATFDDGAAFAILGYERTRGDLRAAALLGRGAANVRALGLDVDLEACLLVDSMPVVARAVREPLRVVKS